MGRREFHPPHVHLEDSCYFVTASVDQRQHLLNTDAKRGLLRDILRSAIEQHGIRLYAWVILANHYHLLLKTADVPLHKFVSRFHGQSGIKLNKLDGTPGRKVWYQYWDRFPRDERDFWAYLNYIHVNPIKHGYVQLSSGAFEIEGDRVRIGGDQSLNVHECLARYPYSSYSFYLDRYGADFLTDAWMRYPIPHALANDAF